MTDQKADLLKRIKIIDKGLEYDRLTKEQRKMFKKRKEGLENELKKLQEQ